jgi:hypothetical protein
LHRNATIAEQSATVAGAGLTSLFVAISERPPHSAYTANGQAIALSSWRNTLECL